MSSLERFSEYRGFGLERFHCILTSVSHSGAVYSETSLNRTLCILKTSLNWTCFQVLLSIFAVHTEAL